MGSKNKTRISRGFKESNYSTPVLMTNNDYFIFPTGDSDQHYLFSIEPLSSESNPLKEKEENIDKEEIEKNYDLDISNYLSFSLPKLNYREIINFIYPSIYSLHEFEYNKELGIYDSIAGEFNIPSVISSSKNSMEENVLYLIDNGYLLIIYKKNISQYILKNLFGVENLSFITMIINEENIFEKSDTNELKERIKNCLYYIRGQKSIYQNLIFVFEGTGGERIINESLIEDNYCKWFPMIYANFYKKYMQHNTIFEYKL